MHFNIFYVLCMWFKKNNKHVFAAVDAILVISNT